MDLIDLLDLGYRLAILCLLAFGGVAALMSLH
jgi:hypothetical protein